MYDFAWIIDYPVGHTEDSQPITAEGGYIESHRDTPLQTERSSQRLKSG